MSDLPDPVQERTDAGLQTMIVRKSLCGISWDYSRELDAWSVV